MSGSAEGTGPSWETPDAHIANAARQYAVSAELVYLHFCNILSNAEHLNPVTCIFPYYTMSGFALELYFKSLKAVWAYDESNEGLNPILSKAIKQGHSLIEAFDSIDSSIRNQLENEFVESQGGITRVSFRSALEPYNLIFVTSRYMYEQANANLPAMDTLRILVSFVGNFIEKMPRRRYTLNQIVLGARLKKAREDKGMGEEQAAKVIELSGEDLAKVERGARDISPSQITKLAKAYRCSELEFYAE